MLFCFTFHWNIWPIIVTLARTGTRVLMALDINRSLYIYIYIYIYIYSTIQNDIRSILRRDVGMISSYDYCHSNESRLHLTAEFTQCCVQTLKTKRATSKLPTTRYECEGECMQRCCMRRFPSVSCCSVPNTLTYN